MKDLRDQLASIDAADGEILHVNKPIGWTSFDVVRIIRAITGIKKVGHAGTLDPFAEGVLLICVGSATKRVSEIMELPKTYQGVIQFGISTDTLDITGRVTDTRVNTDLNLADIESAFNELSGEISQIPPMYSAVKINGKRLYKMARKNQDVEVEPRKVTIYKFVPDSISLPHVHFTVECSKGTYVRSLARDLGSALKCSAFLRSLCRTQVGNYHISSAISLADIIY